MGQSWVDGEIFRVLGTRRGSSIECTVLHRMEREKPGRLLIMQLGLHRSFIEVLVIDDGDVVEVVDPLAAQPLKEGAHVPESRPR